MIVTQKNQSLAYSPRIFRHGLVLILVPLVLGSGVLLLLNHVWRQSEQVAREEWTQCDWTQELYGAFQYWGDITLTMGFAAAGKKASEYQDRIQKNDLELKAGFARLNRLASGRADEASTISRLERLCAIEQKASASMPQVLEGESTLEDLSNFSKHTTQIYKVRTAVKNLLEQEWQRLEAVRRREDSVRQNMRFIAYGSAAATVLLSIFLLILFSKAMGRRLRILTENAAAIPKTEEIVQRVSGNDEFAYLDRVLAESQEKLRQAAEHRLAIIGMVAHDMRSPLMASQVSMEMIKAMNELCSETALKDLNDAIDSLSGVLQYVEELLSTHKTETSVFDMVGSERQEEEKTPEFRFKHLSAFLRPKIFHKGLLLVFLPLLMQSAVLFFINTQMSVAESVANRERFYSNIIAWSNFVEIDIIRAATAQMIYLGTTVASARQLALKNYKLSQHELDQMRELAKNDPEWSECIANWRKFYLQGIGQIFQLNHSNTPTEIAEVFSHFAAFEEDNPDSTRALMQQERLYEKGKRRLKEIEQEQAATSSKMSQILAWSMSANFVVAFVLLLAFSRSISGRVDVLVKNAGRLGNRERLRETLKGKDELAYIDMILHHAQSQLEVLSAERAQIMASLAQEMRRPLQLALSCLERCEKVSETSLTAKAKTGLSRAQNNIGRVLGLIDELLSLETLSIGKVDLEKSSCDLQQLAEDALAAMSSLARRKEIDLVNDCQPISILADKDKLIQVLINYISNAIKFSPAGSAIKVANEDLAESLRVSVSDNGPGMDEQTRRSVFERYFQGATAEKKQGFGLGLAICRLIVESHNGQVGVKSAPGQGSTFWFEIPK